MDIFALRSLQKRLNYVKLVFLFLDVGASVLIKAFVYLYKGAKPPESNLIDLSKVKANNIYPVEKETLEKLKEGKIRLNEMDITLTYKLLQLSCGLTDKNTSEGKLLWSKNCPKLKRHCLENLLFRYKEIRNQIIHDFRNLEELYDDAFEKIRSQSETLLNHIVAEVAVEASLSSEEAIEWKRELRINMNEICRWDLQTGESKDDINTDRKVVLSDFSDDDYKEYKKKKEEKKQNKENEGGGGHFEESEPSKDLADSLKELDENFKVEITNDIPFMDVLQKKKQSKSISFPLFKESRKTVKGDVIKRDILARYRNELPVSYQPNRRAADPSPFPKSNRNYWIDRLLTTDVLDSDVTLQRFVEEYSKDQRETNRITAIFEVITSKF